MNRKTTGSLLLAVIAAALGTAACQSVPVPDPDPEADVKGTMNVNMSDTLKISDIMFGIFFEDINYGADGGLYAELVANRDFECTPADNRRDRSWSDRKFWTVDGQGMKFDIATDKPIHANNPHYGVISVTAVGPRLINEGFGGFRYEKGAK